MADEIYHWRYFCITEGVLVDEWRQQRPACCHRNPAHNIDDNSMTVIGQIKSDVMKVDVEEEDVDTGKHYRAYTNKLTAITGQTASKVVTFGFPISMLCGGATVPNDGDEVQMAVAPGYPLGKLNGNVSAGAVEIPVVEGVLNAVDPGYILTLIEGAKSEDFYVNSLDDVNNRLKVSPLVNAYTSNADLKITRRLLHSGLTSLAVLPKGVVRFGDVNIKSTYIPANCPIVATYKNNSNVESTLYFNFEYFF